MPGTLLTRARKDTATIDDYAKDIQKIWPPDKTRPVLLQWLLVVAHASTLAEEVRKSAWDKVVHEVGEVFVWWLTFILRINEPPEDNAEAVFHLPCLPSQIIWSKFPNLCPVCFAFGLDEARSGELVTRIDFSEITIQEDEMLQVYEKVRTGCGCLTRKRFVESRSVEFKRFTKDQLSKLCELEQVREGRPESLSDLESKLKNIFEPTIYVLTAEEIAFHLLEEIGEVSEALANLMMQPIHGEDGVLIGEEDFLKEHNLRLRNLREELADVFSWTITMREKAHLILSRATKYTEYAGTRHTSDAMWNRISGIVEEILNDTSNLVDLVWLIYGRGDELKCEKCQQRPCDQGSEVHKLDSGHLWLWDDEVRSYFHLIKTLEGCDQLDRPPQVPGNNEKNELELAVNLPPAKAVNSSRKRKVRAASVKRPPKRMQ